MFATISESFKARSVTMEDLESIVDLLNTEHRWLHGVNAYEVEGIRSEWEAPIFNLATDSQAIYLPNGQPIGYAEFWDVRAPHVNYYAYATVHPEHLQRGIGSYLAEWLENRARQNIIRSPEGTRITLHQNVESQHKHACDFLQKIGYLKIRNLYRMSIDITQPPPQPDIPQGITIRSIQNEDEERMAILTKQDSFMDHWGAVDESAEEYYQRHKYINDHDPNYDPSLWFIALDGDEVVGVSLCYPKIDEDPEMGWVGTLGVRRSWRKHGLGLSLLKHSFLELYKRGKARVGLGVDASSLTGATRLYEKAGMHIIRLYHTFELELRPGKDLLRQSIDN